jgi:DNA-binding NarL/FixJ family response regulator
VLLADDHAIVLEAFKRLLEPDFEVVGTVTNGRALVDAADELRPDLILVDVGMPQLNGLDACERIRQRLPQAKLIFLTMTEDPETAAEAIRRGASGYLLKTSAPTELFDAIQQVLRGRTYVTSAIADGPVGVFVEKAERSKAGGLSLREREVLQLLAEGRSMKEAAGILGVTPRTIAFHKYAMMERLGLKSGAELVQHAVAVGLVAKRHPIA